MASIMNTHLGWVQKLKDRGETVLQPEVGEPMGHIDGYIKTQIPHKDAGSIFQDKYGTFGLFGDFGALHVTGIKWEDLGLCDARCWYEWMDSGVDMERCIEIIPGIFVDMERYNRSIVRYLDGKVYMRSEQWGRLPDIDYLVIDGE